MIEAEIVQAAGGYETAGEPQSQRCFEAYESSNILQHCTWPLMSNQRQMLLLPRAFLPSQLYSSVKDTRYSFSVPGVNWNEF